MWEVIFTFANQHVLAFTAIVLSIVAGFIFLNFKFSLEWDGFKPKFKSRKLEGLVLEQAQARAKELEELLKFVQQPDFLKKTENGEYIGFIVAKKPHISIWTDGNWNTEEYFQQFDRLERLWEAEEEIVINGKNPNIPSDLYHVIEKKAKDLPSLTIYCGPQISSFLTKYFGDYKSVKIISRG